MKISNSDFIRYSKQIILKKIGIKGQKKIASAKVLIIGVGGLGCPMLLYLANSGVRKIGLVDEDKVNLSNLNRQILFNTKDVGKFKVIQAKKVVKKINNKIQLSIFKEKIKAKNIKSILDKFDIICDCTDNFETRYLINDYCMKMKKILISSAINKYDGHVFNFDFKKNIPCFRCFMPEIPTLENKCDADGLFPTLAGIAGTIQANEVIKSILGMNNSLNGKMIIFNAMNMKFRVVKLTKNPKCTIDCKKK
tara:strand:- start:706 stop:1458 length:753 start_codon:yes stop_codon:yes gene_type:complete